MPKPTPADLVQSHAALTVSCAAAIADALRVGLSPSAVAFVLQRLAELLESEE